MTELFLVRHGQADSAGDNYDQLTATGHEQAHLLGQWLASQGYSFARYAHGGLKRQQQTLEAIRQQLAPTGVTLPEAEILPGLAEFDLQVWGLVAGALRHGHPEFAELLKQWNRARHENAKNKGDIFKQLTGIILAEWVKQGEGFSGAESFPAFQRRVLSVLSLHNAEGMQISDAGDAREIHSSRILAVTSGGPISLLTGHVLGLDLAHTLGLMRRIYNTSLHHFVFTGKRWELAGFNNIPHLPLSGRTLV